MTHQEAVDTLATERYLLKEMSADDRLAFEEHFFTCDACATDLRETTALLQGARDGYATPAPSGNVVAMPPRRAALPRLAWYRSVLVPWAAAATLAVLAGYQTFWLLPAMRRASPLALAPVTLRPESRGSEPVVAVDARNTPVSLALELGDAPQSSDLVYDLRSTDGHDIVSGHLAAPEPGTPVLLLMPSWTLIAPMHYILSVHEASASGRSLGEYRFAVTTR